MCPAHAVLRAPPRPPYAARRLQWAGRPVSCRSGADALPCATRTCGPPLCTVYGRAFAWPPAGRDCVRVMRCVYLMRPGSASVKPDRSLLYTRLSAHAITRVPRTGPCKRKTPRLRTACRPIPPRQVGQLPRVGLKVHRTVDVGVLVGRHVRHHHLCHGARGRGRSQRRAAATSDSDSLPSSTPPRSRRARRRACRPRLPPRQQPPPSYARA